MWDIVWVSPQGHRSVFVSRHFLLQAPQCPCSVRKRFSRDHCCRGRSLTLDYWQPQTTDNDFQRAAAFLSVSVMDYDCRRFSADTLWICVIFGHGKTVLKKKRHLSVVQLIQQQSDCCVALWDACTCVVMPCSLYVGCFPSFVTIRYNWIVHEVRICRGRELHFEHASWNLINQIV